MVSLEAIGPFSLWSTVMLDVLLILLCTLPALYFWLYRPMTRHISERIRAQENVRESERKLSFHLQNTPIAVIEWNLDFEVIAWNAAAERIFGYTREEALGQHAVRLLVPESNRTHVDRIWKDLIKNTGGSHSTNENLTKDGCTIVCEWSNTPLVDDFGEIYGVASLAQDITESRKANEALRESEERFRETIANTGVGYFFIDTEGMIREVNAAWVEMYKYSSAEEIIGRHFTEIQQTDDVEKAKEFVDGIMAGDSRFLGGEFSRKCKDGSVGYHTFSARPVSRDGQVIGLEGFVVDTTEGKLSSAALAASEERFRTQMVQSPQVMEIYNLDGLQIEVNQAYQDLWGFSAETSLNKFNILESKEVEETGLLEYVKRAYAGEAVTVPEYVFDPTGETESGGPGRVRWLSTKIYPLRDSAGDVTDIVITHEDITDRRLAEERLKESDKKSRAWLENSSVCTKVMDLDFNLKYMSSAGIKALGVDDVTQLYGKPYPFHFYPDSFRKQMTMSLEKAKATGEVIMQEASVVDLDGKELWFHSTIVPVNDDEGRLDYIMVLSLETTERKEAEKALAKEVKLSEAIINALPGIFFMYADDGTLVRWNRNHEIVSGYSADEMAGMTALEWFEEKDRAAIAEAINQVFEKGEGHIRATPLLKDGTAVTFDYSAQRLDLDGRSYLVGVALDVSENIRLQELESRAQRLETAGTIAGQVAHDFNNLLAPLMAYPDFIRESLPADHPALVYLDDIERSAEQIAEINQQLLSLGRRGHYNQKALNLNEIVDQAVKDLPLLPDSITLVTDLDPKLMSILGGGAQIHRVVVNLLSNAVDATQSIGQVAVKTENCYVDGLLGSFGRVPMGEYVKMTIADTGHGISSDFVSRILDPFFTTKTSDKARGSGLGLSVVDAVIKDHGGYLDLETAEGKGTSIYVYWPVARDAVEDCDPVETTGGTETVLVIDDDEMQRSVSTNLLTRLGYQTTSVDSGEKAVEYLQEHPHDLLILDMVMAQGIDGTETFRRILAFNPDQRAVIVSGFSESVGVQEVQALGAGAFVKKPLTRQTLAEAVRTELDRKKELHNTP
jgi:PAS domain S-box-containing protein